MHKLRLITGFLLLLAPLALQAQQSLTMERLSDNWWKYDATLDAYVPLGPNEQPGKLVFAPLHVGRYQYFQLNICAQPGLSVFSGNQLLYQLSDTCASVPLEDWPDLTQKDTLWLTFYHPEAVGPKPWEVSVTQSIVPVFDDINNDPIQPEPRRKNAFLQFQVVVLITLLAFLTTLLNTYPRLFGEYFSALRPVSVIVRDEGLYRTGFFESTNLLFSLCYGMSLSWLFMLLFHDLGRISSVLIWAQEITVWTLLLHWLALSIASIGLLFVKWVSISLIGSAFDLALSRRIQFYDYFRLGLLFTTIGAVLCALLQIIFPGFDFSWSSMLVTVASVFVVFRIGVLFLKLARNTQHRNVHLFSYLCTTEIAPAAVFLKIFMSL